MANTKTGFDYYNVDTDRYQDRRIKRLKKDFGCNGIAVYDYILCEIYRVRGCFTEWDENTAFDVAEYLGLKESLVGEIIRYCCAVGLFDKELFTSGSVLTSKSIQRRYVEMCKRAKRATCEIPEKYMILPEECEIITEESPKLLEVCDNSKVEYSKVEKSKVDKSKISLSIASDSEREKFLEIFFFVHCLKNPVVEMERFINHYQGIGWVNSKGVAIQDKMAVAMNWTCKENISKHPASFMKKWHIWYQSIASTTPEARLMITDLEGVTEHEGNVALTISKPLMSLLESNIAYAKGLFQRVSYRVRDTK